MLPSKEVRLLGGIGLFLCFLAARPAARAHSPIIGITPTSIEFRANAGADSPPQYLLVQNTTHKTMAFTISCSGAWLLVGPQSGYLPGARQGETAEITFLAQTRALQPGVHSTTCTIIAPGGPDYPPADNSPYSFAVTAVIIATAAPPKVRATPESLSFNEVAGASKTFSGTIAVSNAGAGTLNWTAAVSPASAAWLRVAPASGTGAATVTVQATTTGLAAGTYSATVRLTSPESTAAVAVTLTLRAPQPAVLQTGASSLAFTAQAGASPPAPDIIPVANGGESPLNWTASAATFNGGNWLKASPANGINQGVVQASADIAGLSAGTYAGRITLTAAGAANSPAQIPVTLVVKPAPALVNAASYATGPLASCSLATAFGDGIGPVRPAAASGAFPLELGGTSVTVAGSLAPMIYSSATQVSFQIPCGLAAPDAAVRINYAGGQPVEFRVQLLPAAPGLFTVDGTRAAALNVDYSLNTPSTPAPAGGAIQLFMTGQGAVDPAIATGAASTAPYPAPLLPVTATIGGRDATVLFAGLAPGLVGLLQVNLAIPPETEPSPAAVVNVSVGPYAAKPATISVSAAPPPQ